MRFHDLVVGPRIAAIEPGFFASGLRQREPAFTHERNASSTLALRPLQCGEFAVLNDLRRSPA